MHLSGSTVFHMGLHNINVCMVLAVLIIPFSSIEATCTYSINSEHAAARYNLSGGASPYFTYSCTPTCVHTDSEVHVLSMYRAPQVSEHGAVQVTIEAVRRSDIRLMLINQEAVHWIIKTPDKVAISHIALLAPTVSKVSVNVDGRSSPSISHTNSKTTGWDSAEMEDVVKAKFGFLSSYTGVYEASTWMLTVGNCIKIPSEVTTPPTIQHITTTIPEECRNGYQGGSYYREQQRKARCNIKPKKDPDAPSPWYAVFGLVVLIIIGACCKYRKR